MRAVDDATDTEARTEMMYAAMLAGIAFNAAGCHLPHGLSYAVSGLDARTGTCDGYPEGKTLVPHGMAVVLNNPSVWRYTAPAHPRAPSARRALPRRRRPTARRADDAGEVLAGRVIELMRATGMPNGLSALGFDDDAPRRARRPAPSRSTA